MVKWLLFLAGPLCATLITDGLSSFDTASNFVRRPFSLLVTKTSSTITFLLTNQAIAASTQAMIKAGTLASVSVTEMTLVKTLTTLAGNTDISFTVISSRNKNVSGGYEVYVLMLPQRQNITVSSAYYQNWQSLGLAQYTLFFWQWLYGSDPAKFWFEIEGGTLVSHSYSTLFSIVSTTGKVDSITYTWRFKKEQIEAIGAGSYYFAGTLFQDNYAAMTSAQQNSYIDSQIAIRSDLIAQIDMSLAGNNTGFPLNAAGLANLRVNRTLLAAQVTALTAALR